MRKLETEGFLHGGDYNPEQWLHMPEILEQDIRYFKQAHINEVTLGVFAWAALEPEEGRYEFGWMERIIERMAKEGIGVILATPSGARPKWLSDRYPEVLRVSENGERNYFGGRHNHCYSSPVYREKTRAVNGELAKRFGNHPAVKLWHISNEYGGACYCPLCQQKFREWLKERFSSIEELNRSWCTGFWSHTYQNFDQIEAPSSRGESMLHGLTLDWKRFVTAQTRDFMEEEIAAIREAGSEKPVTTNFMYRYDGLDYRELAKSVDIVSWDTYPTWHKGPVWKTALDCGMQHDLFRSMKKQPFLLMESSPSSTNWQPVSKLRKPGMIQAAGLQALAHGSDSVMYFQIRQSRGASEKFHGAVIDHYGGNDTRVFGEVTETGEVLKVLREIAGSGLRSEIAILYEWQNRWALEDAQGPRNAGMYYEECVQKIYESFRAVGQNIDFIGSEDTLEGYRILAIPMGYLLSDAFTEKVREFVARGGTLLATYWTGVVDEHDLCYLGETPHGLTEVLGLQSMEIDGLYDGESNGLIAAETELVKTEQLKADRAKTGQEAYECRNLCELVRLQGAVALYVYEKDFYAGMPAVTVHQYGLGLAYYVCADVESACYRELAERMTRALGMRPPLFDHVPKGVELTVRSKDHKEYLFVQNFAEEEVALPETEEWNWLYGERKVIPPLGTSVYWRKLRIMVTDDDATVFWEKPESCAGLTGKLVRYQLILDGKLAVETERTHGTIGGLKEDTEYKLEVRRICMAKIEQDEEGVLVWSGYFRTGMVKKRLDITSAPYLAVGDGRTMNTGAIQQAIWDCGENDVVYIPAGIFLTGALRLHDHMEIYLEEGAILQGSQAPEDYLPRIPSRFEGLEMECYQSLLNLGNLNHEDGCTSGYVLIRGKGTISGGGRTLAERTIETERICLKDDIQSLGDQVLEYENEDTIPGRARGRLINISNAAHVRITGLTLQNGPGWNVHMIYSEDIVTDHCVFRSEDVWNGDGWDPDSSTNCAIFACTFYTGDDSVAIKSGKNPEGNIIARPCTNIRIFDCKCAYGHGITLGSEMSGGIEDVAIWDCDLGDSVYGIEIKGTKKRGGFVRDISVKDCLIPRILMHSVQYNDDGEGAAVPPVFERCQFEHVHILGKYLDKERRYQPCTAVELYGFDIPGHEIRDITFRRVRIGSGDKAESGWICMEHCEGIRFEDIAVD